MPEPDRLVTRMQGFGTTVFAEMSALAVATGAVNLGQGFPDTDGPALILDAAVEAIRSGANQYPPGIGVPVLRQAISDHQHRCYGLDYDPDTEVLVTAGATEAIAAAMLGLLEPGDEVIAFEPFYDSYAACIAMAGAVRVPLTLRAPTFRPDLDALDSRAGAFGVDDRPEAVPLGFVAQAAFHRVRLRDFGNSFREHRCDRGLRRWVHASIMLPAGAGRKRPEHPLGAFEG